MLAFYHFYDKAIGMNNSKSFLRAVLNYHPDQNVKIFALFYRTSKIYAREMIFLYCGKVKSSFSRIDIGGSKLNFLFCYLYYIYIYNLMRVLDGR